MRRRRLHSRDCCLGNMAARCACAEKSKSPEFWFCISRLPSGDGSSDRGGPERPAASGYAAPAQSRSRAERRKSDPAQIAPLVAEVIAKNVSVIMASGPPVLNAARSATRTIPIVAIHRKRAPVASGVELPLRDQGATSLAYSSIFQTSRRKWMEIIVECNPKLSRAAVFWDTDTGPVQLDLAGKLKER